MRKPIIGKRNGVWKIVGNLERRTVPKGARLHATLWVKDRNAIERRARMQLIQMEVLGRCNDGWHRDGRQCVLVKHHEGLHAYTVKYVDSLG